MTYGSKICSICGRPKLGQEFAPCGVNNIFYRDSIGTICYECIAEKVEFNDLDQVDKLCQMLDVPFLANQWLALYKKYNNREEILREYIKEVREGEYNKSSWKQYNLLWDKVRETDTVLKKLPTLESDLFLYLRKKWGSYEDFGIEQYMKMESYEKNTLNFYNFRDEARRDMVRKLALVSVLIDRKLAAGDTREVTALISSYQSLMKESGIQNAVHNDTETIESLSELIAFLEKNNWLMDYKITESRDIVDATIRNFQQYVQSLVTGSGEELSQMYSAKLAEEEAGTEINEEDIEAMFESQAAEEESLDEEGLNEEELIQMFKDISKEYDK